MISGERSANCASSFLRSAGASCAAAALRWRTRPARSSSTAGSGMPATTALTAAASTGLTARTSSRDGSHIVQPPRHQRGGGDADESRDGARQRQIGRTRRARDSARPAASRTMAECRSRSGHGAKKEEERNRLSPWRRLLPSALTRCSSNRLSSTRWRLERARRLSPRSRYARMDGLMSRLGVGTGRQSAHALQSRAEDNLPKRQQDYRYDERRNIIEHAEQQHAGQQLFPVHLPQPDQHGGVEHAEPAGRMAGETQQRRRDEDHRDHDEAEIAARPAPARTSPARRTRDRRCRSRSAAASAARPAASRSRARGRRRAAVIQTQAT